MNSKNKKIDLSIVIPALNEEMRIANTLDELARFLDSDKTIRQLVVEVLIVSADGHDQTHQIALKHGKNFKHFKLLLPGKKVGKGRDVQFGMLRAKGEVVVFMDADLATPLHHLPEFYQITTQGFGVVVATRNLKKHHSHLLRRLLSITGNMAFRVLGGVWTEDSQCGFKMFTNKAVEICFNKQTVMGWGFDMEILSIARANKLDMEFVRINDWIDQPGGTFESGKIIDHALGSFKELGVIATNRFLGKYH